MKNKIFSIFFFFMFLSGGFFYFNNVFSSENNFNNSMDEFEKKTKNSNIDLLFLGSSHAYTAFNPTVINNECKTNSFHLGSGAQILPVTNLILNEALEKTNPELIILEVYPNSYVEKLSKKIKGYELFALDRVPFYKTKKLPVVLKYYDAHEILGVYSPVIRNHKRWRWVDYFDFNRKNDLDNYMYFKDGFFARHEKIDTVKFSKYLDFRSKPIKINTSNQLNELFRNELSKIIERAKECCKQLLVVTAPELLAKYDDYFSFYEELKMFCEKSNVDYLNLNNYYNEIDLKIEDFEDPSHLNIVGAHKTSKFLSQYINQHFVLTDRSKEENWKINNKNYENYLIDFIEKDEISFSVKLQRELKSEVVIDSLQIKRSGDEYQVHVFFEQTETLLKERSLYNLSFNIIPKKSDFSLVNPKNKKRDRNFDSKNVPLNNLTQKRFFTIKSKINNINSIYIYLYNAKAYQGVVGNPIIIKEVSLL